MRKHKDHVKVAGPSGVRPTRMFGQTEMNPVGYLMTRANLRKNFHQLKAQMRRAARKVEYFDDRKDANGNPVPKRVLHETKGWQSARVGL